MDPVLRVLDKTRALMDRGNVLDQRWYILRTDQIGVFPAARLLLDSLGLGTREDVIWTDPYQRTHAQGHFVERMGYVATSVLSRISV